MLTLFARHSLCDLTIQADGDIEVDMHHTVEDTGIALGQAFTKALGDKDEALRSDQAQRTVKFAVSQKEQASGELVKQEQELAGFLRLRAIIGQGAIDHDDRSRRLHELVDLAGGTVVDRDRIAFFGDVEGQV